MDRAAESLESLLDAVPWERLAHAYDAAVDAPARLRTLSASTKGLRDTEPDAFDDWMLSSVVHQGTPYSATAPVLWVSRRILSNTPNHPAVGTCLLVLAECATALRWAEPREADMHSELVLSRSDQPPWATFVAEPLNPKGAKSDRVDDAYFTASTVDPESLVAALRDWEQSLIDCIDERRFVDEAMCAASAMIRLDPSPNLESRLWAVIADWDRLELRCAAAYALAASSLPDDSIESLLMGGDRGIRVAAALGRPDHPSSLPQLLTAAAERSWVAHALPRGFYGPEPWLTSSLITTVLDRVDPTSADPNLIEGLEEQLATQAYGPLGATYEWGPIIAWLFPSRWQVSAYEDMPAPADLTPTQRRLLGALTRNDDPWKHGMGNAGLVLGRVGLPHDRSRLRALSGERRWARWPRRRHRS